MGVLLGLHSGASAWAQGTQGGEGGVGGTGETPGTEDQHPEQQSYTQKQSEDDGHNLTSTQDPGNCRHTG